MCAELEGVRGVHRVQFEVAETMDNEGDERRKEGRKEGSDAQKEGRKEGRRGGSKKVPRKMNHFTKNASRSSPSPLPTHDSLPLGIVCD